MSATNRLALPLLDAAQAQKHVTHNEALTALDVLVQLTVSARNVTAPPSPPSDGQRVLIGPGASGAFTGHDGSIAAYDNGGWAFYPPHAGWLLYIANETALLLFNGTAWIDVSGLIRALQNLSGLGIGTTSDATNVLAAKLNGALFTARTITESGSGDMRMTLNKSAVGNTVSQLYQTNYSGRAETGLSGDDRFRVKVSADGATWKDAIRVEAASGKVSMPSGRIHAASMLDIADFISVPAAPTVYRIDRQHDQNPRSLSIASLSGDTVALTTADADLFFTSFMAGNSFVRIWNTSKSPNQSAWAKNAPDTSHLQVTNAQNLTGWTAGETIVVGDPTGVTAGRAIAIDISPMLQTIFGAVFPQKALLLKAVATGISAKLSFDLSPSGLTGTYANVYTPTDGSTNGTQVTVPSSVLSPISNSNLLFVRETITVSGAVGTVLATVMGVYV